MCSDIVTADTKSIYRHFLDTKNYQVDVTLVVFDINDL